MLASTLSVSTNPELREREGEKTPGQTRTVRSNQLPGAGCRRDAVTGKGPGLLAPGPPDMAGWEP